MLFQGLLEQVGIVYEQVVFDERQAFVVGGSFEEFPSGLKVLDP